MESFSKNWSNIPKEIVSTIISFLDDPTNILQLGGVCKQWREAVLLDHVAKSPPPPLKFTCPFGTGNSIFLSEFSIYFLHPHTISASTLENHYLIEIDDTYPLNLPSKHAYNFSNHHKNGFAFPKYFNWLDFKWVKLGKSYALYYGDDYKKPKSFMDMRCMIKVNKVIRSSYPDDHCSIFLIFDGGKLGFMKHGEARGLMLVDSGNSDYQDIIVFKGKPYVVDMSGTISWISMDLKLNKISSPCDGYEQFFGRKHLLISCGQLHVVARYSSWHYITNLNVQQQGYLNLNDNFDFKVYKLIMEEGKHSWMDVNEDLDGGVFLLSNDFCYWALGYKGDSIYFNDPFNRNFLSCHNQGCYFFQLRNSKSAEYLWSWPRRFFNSCLKTKLWMFDCSRPQIKNE